MDIARKVARPPFESALRSAPMGLIAEIKQRSPSAGTIRSPFEPERIARSYERAGAQAISVLVDERYFGGGESVFRLVRESVALPLLYKEFVVDEWQVWHAAALGASAILLIVTALDSRSLERLLATCAEAKIEALVETHNEEDMARIRGLPVRCVGINNRDLRTLHTSLEVTLRLREQAPEGVTLVSESGIRTPEDVEMLSRAGVHAILVGESLLKQQDVEAAARRLMSRVWNR